MGTATGFARVGFSFAKLVSAATGGPAYDHPAIQQGSGRFGRIIDVSAAAGIGKTAPASLTHANKNLLIADVLRPPLIMQAAGANVIDEVDPQYNTIGSLENLEARWLVGDQSVPAEDVTTSGATIGDSVCIARVEFSRQFKMQSPTAEALLTNSIRRAMLAALDKGAVAGTGGYSPKGLINEPAFHLEPGPVDGAALIDDAQQLAIDGCDPSLISIIASAHNMREMLAANNNVRGVSTEGRVTTDALFSLNGFGIRFTPYLAAGEAITGQFNQMNIVYYEKPQIIVDPYTEGAAGKTRIAVFQACGIVANHTKAFIRRRP